MIRGKIQTPLFYEPRHGEVYVFITLENSVTVINAKIATVAATIPLEEHGFAAVG